MPRRSNDFQKLVYIIQQQLAPDFQVVESYMLTDSVTSEEREVDIVISSPSNISPFVIGIECCDRSRKASVEWVEQMWAKHHDLPTTKLMLAARAGYSRSARFKATARGIDIIDYSEAIKADWSKVLKLWRDSLIVAVAIKWSYLLAVIVNGNSEAFIPMRNDDQLQDQETGLVFTAKSLAEDLLKMHRVEELVISQAELNKDQDFIIDFAMPNERYLVLQSEQVPLRTVRIIARVQKQGEQITLHQAILGDTRIAYSHGQILGGKFILSAVEDSAHNSKASLHFTSSDGSETTMIMTPSSDLAQELDELRNSQ